MRLYIPMTVTLLFGVLGSVGNCYQVPLPTLTGSEGKTVVDAPRFKSEPVVTTTAPEGFSNVFDSALSQFPQHRVARRTVTPAEPKKTIEASSRFQSRPTVQQAKPLAPKVKTVLEKVPALADSQAGQFKNASTTIQQSGVPNEFELLETAEPIVVGSKPIEQSHVPLRNSPSDFQFTPQNQFQPSPLSGNSWVAPRTNFPSTPTMSGYPLHEAPVAIAPATLALPALAPALTPAMEPTPTPAPVVSATPQVDRDESLTWWKRLVVQSLDGSRETESVDSNSLVYQTLQNSPRIQAVSQNPLIRELQIVEADAEFDAVQYVRSQFEDRVDPVGNSLTVGTGESFLKDNIWTADFGLTKKNRNGATWELNQRLGFQNSNSNFFVPQDQGTATLALNVTQPLLRGRGKYVNQSQILIAQASSGAAWQTFHSELQDELLGVVSSYWDLYLNRSVYLQKQRNVQRGEKILTRLEGRAGLDSLPSQIARARSSVQTRRTELANAARDVRNAETEVRRRIADNSWMHGGGSELIPGELPTALTFQLPLEQVVYGALQHRPEIHEALSRARIATVQRNVSANELLPELSLLLGSYVSALRGDTGIENAFQDQFGQVKPGYSVGFNFELPYGNRAARSRLAQRQLQVKTIKHEVDEVMQNVIAESQVALRRVESASETLVAATEAIRAAQADRNQFEKRWESFALVEGDLAEGQNPTTVLDQLLDSQDRLASAELVYVQAERELKVSEVALQRAMGTLLMRQSVSTARGFDRDTPRIDLFKDGNQLVPGSMGVQTGEFLPADGQFITPTSAEMSIPHGGLGIQQ